MFIAIFFTTLSMSLASETQMGTAENAQSGDNLVVQPAQPQLTGSTATKSGGLEPPPWTLVYTDGSNNSTRLWMKGEAIAWTYNPVRPAESSSGTYSGGEPGEGQATVDAATAVWAKLRLIETTEGTPPDGTRRMGTGWFAITTASGTRSFVVEHSDGLRDFEAALRLACQ